MTSVTAQFGQLHSGKRYTFHAKDWETPLGEVIPGKAKTRRFVGTRSLGPVGMPKIPFLVVARDDGSSHLIAVETIAKIEAVEESESE